MVFLWIKALHFSTMARRNLEIGLVLLVLIIVIVGAQARKNHRPYKENDLTVVSIEAEPYLMKGENGEYQGYTKDVLDRLVSLLNVRYSIYMVPDNQYGYMYASRRWNGMIKEILDNNADLAAAPLHSTFTRARVVDFTYPIMNVSATLLVKKPTENEPLLIKSPKDLQTNDNVQFGTLKTGTIIRDFKTNNSSLVQDLWAKMNSFHTDPFSSSNSEGIRRVRASGGKFAFIMPSDIAEYMAGRSPCDLLTVGSLFPRSFSFATKKNSQHMPLLNRAIAHLTQSGELHKLYQKWWRDTRHCPDFTYTDYLKSSSRAYYKSHSASVHYSTNYSYLLHMSFLLLLTNTFNML